MARTAAGAGVPTRIRNTSRCRRIIVRSPLPSAVVSAAFVRDPNPITRWTAWDRNGRRSRLALGTRGYGVNGLICRGYFSLRILGLLGGGLAFLLLDLCLILSLSCRCLCVGR